MTSSTGIVSTAHFNQQTTHVHATIMKSMTTIAIAIFQEPIKAWLQTVLPGTRIIVAANLGKEEIIVSSKDHCTSSSLFACVAKHINLILKESWRKGMHVCPRLKNFLYY